MSVNEASRWCREIDVIEPRFPEFEKIIAKLTRKGDRLGRMPLLWSCLGHSVHTRYNPATKQDETYRTFKVEIFGEDCRIEGWKPICTVDLVNNTAVIEPFVTADPEEIRVNDDYIRSRAGKCDHCGQNRERKYCVALTNETGEVKVVGRTCLKEFTRCSFDALAYLADLKKIDDLFRIEWCDPSELYIDTDRFLSQVIAIARVDGFVSGRKAEETGRSSTMNTYHMNYMIQSLTHQGHYNPRYDVTDADRAMVADVRAFVKSITPNPADGFYTYQQNLKALLDDVSMSPARNAAMTASAVGYYLNHVKRLARDAERAQAAATSDFVGTEGQRVKSTPVRFLGMTPCGYGQFGERFLVRLATPKGDVISWFTTSRCDMRADQTYSVSFTVKKHDTFRGVRQTQVSRLMNHGVVQ